MLIEIINMFKGPFGVRLGLIGGSNNVIRYSPTPTPTVILGLRLPLLCPSEKRTRTTSQEDKALELTLTGSNVRDLGVLIYEAVMMANRTEHNHWLRPKQVLPPAGCRQWS